MDLDILIQFHKIAVSLIICVFNSFFNGMTILQVF